MSGFIILAIVIAVLAAVHITASRSRVADRRSETVDDRLHRQVRMAEMRRCAYVPPANKK